jgi:predicted CopG family antitoxin
MRKYTTISVPEEVKRLLERAKGREEWGKFLLGLYTEVKRMRGEEAFQRLAETLTDEDLKSVIESSREFRGRFTLR